MVKRVIQYSVFAALSLWLTGWLYLAIADLDRSDTFGLQATFSDIAGLAEGDDVKLAGVRVGRVTDIDVVAGSAVVSFGVETDIVVPRDSAVAVRWRNLIGQRYLSIEPGTDSVAVADGDTMEATRDVVDLGALVNQLSPLARSVSPEDFNQILTALLQAFEGNDANFDSLLASLDTILGSVSSRSDTISQLLGDVSVLGEALASRDAQFESMLDNLVAISETFADNDQLIEAALGDFAGVSDRLARFLTTTADDFGAGLEALAVITGTASDHVTELEASLRNLPGVFAELLPAVNRGEYLRVSVLCFTFETGQCPWPMSVSNAGGGFTIAPGDDPGLTVPPVREDGG